MDFDASDNHGALGPGEKRRCFFDRLFGTLRVVFAAGVVVMIGMDDLWDDFDLVAWNFDVAGALVADHRVEDAVDLAEGDGRIVQLGTGDAEFFENFKLRAKIANLVMEEWIV